MQVVYRTYFLFLKYTFDICLHISLFSAKLSSVTISERNTMITIKHPIDFPETSTTARLTTQLEQAVSELNAEHDIVFLTDLLGGTPFRVASTLAMQRPGSEVITGTNLQLLLEMVLERDGLSSEAFRLQALECGHRGLTSLVDELGRCREEAPAEEGI